MSRLHTIIEANNERQSPHTIFSKTHLDSTDVGFLRWMCSLLLLPDCFHLSLPLTMHNSKHLAQAGKGWFWLNTVSLGGAGLKSVWSGFASARRARARKNENFVCQNVRETFQKGLISGISWGQKTRFCVTFFVTLFGHDPHHTYVTLCHARA